MFIQSLEIMARAIMSPESGAFVVASINPEEAVEIPLRKRELLARAFLPIRSWTRRIKAQAGKIVVDVKLKITKGEYFSPLTFLEMAS